MHLELYIGTKAVKAALMTRGEYNALRGWEVPADENPADAGYLVEYMDGGRTNVPGFSGYVSWSPRDVFERAYRRPRGMDFGQALTAMRAGICVRRAGWNGKGMHLFIAQGSHDFKRAPAEQGLIAGIGEELFNTGDAGTITRLPAIAMHTSRGEHLIGWLATQTDMLAEDWEVA